MKWVRTIIVCVVVGGAGVAGGTPANQAALGRHYDRFLAKRLAACATCHVPTEKKNPETLEEIPHNAFGAALRRAGEELRAAGLKRDLPARLARVAGLDSDGDGVANEAEVLLGHSPGDAKDTPRAAELSALGEKQAALAGYLAGYRWQPFEALARPAVPSVREAGWVRNPLDAFVAAAREERGLGHNGEAPRGVLLRRVYLDLIGLNPTPGQIAAFEADAAADAYEKVVDGLLADPRYGQRWARHWLDVWRYSDWAGWTDGGQIRDSQPHIWRWRDWTVESLNAGKGYDAMVTEMLAADELAPADPGALRATGFLARNFKMLSREQWLEDTVNHTARGLLGVTMHCAKCHDHPFDSVTQEEYYQFRAIFEPHDVRLDYVPGSVDPKADGLARVYDKDATAATYFFVRGDERSPDKARGAIGPGVPEMIGGELAIPKDGVKLPPSAARPGRQAFVRAALLEQAAGQVRAAELSADGKRRAATAAAREEAELTLTAAKAKQAALMAVLKVEEFEDAEKTGPERDAAATAAWAAQKAQDLADAKLARAKAAAKVEAAEQKRAAAVSKSADAKAARPAVEGASNDAAKAKKELADAEKALAAAEAALKGEASTAYKPRAVAGFPATSTGRRAALARWLVAPENPVVARVAANHVWLRHFGRGIVPTPDDFGRGGRPPTHPALLDWLAAELRENGWKLKPLHRLIVTSATYRMSSAPDARATAVDPDNAWHWRTPSKRIEAELVRDNVLWAAGTLDVSAGGPEVDHKFGLTSARRSLYLRVAPEKEVEFLKLFDGPNPVECYARRTSVMPQQALALGNSKLAVDGAKAVARRVAGEDGEFVEKAYLLVLARRPTGAEREECLKFLSGAKETARARENLALVLFNHSDFVTVR
ncbi:MAG TPA: DUF1549 and DUF1553 domain-containing protein [Tepidisphaeraceae bacterium]|nr:DUF1549 and DUF1553 domain-containing protein [Tepidisphaeraceae bacterium]